MYCPKCGAHNFDDAKFCRACGVDISFVPQALTMQMPEGVFGVLEVEEKEQEGRKDRKYKFKEPPTIEKGLESIFEGVGFMVIFLIGFYYYWTMIWIWVWAILPALGCVGKGLGQIAQARSLSKAQALRSEASTLPHAPTPAELPARDTSEIAGHPLSVTEGTTRHLDAARPPQV
jgi:zinc-ribbon domain